MRFSSCYKADLIIITTENSTETKFATTATTYFLRLSFSPVTGELGPNDFHLSFVHASFY